ncbi:hypothetical protein Taro_032341, partial [Colocasia esculenta]|nr:hypothetical protein [Colocasia esculenta]
MYCDFCYLNNLPEVQLGQFGKLLMLLVREMLIQTPSRSVGGGVPLGTLGVRLLCKVRARAAGCSCHCAASVASVVARRVRAVAARLALDSLAVVFLVWRMLAGKSSLRCIVWLPCVLSGALVVLVEVLPGPVCVASAVLLAAVFSLMVYVVWSLGCAFWRSVPFGWGLRSGEVLPGRLLALLGEVLPKAAPFCLGIIGQGVVRLAVHLAAVLASLFCVSRLRWWDFVCPHGSDDLPRFSCPTRNRVAVTTQFWVAIGSAIATPRPIGIRLSWCPPPAGLSLRTFWYGTRQVASLRSMTEGDTFVAVSWQWCQEGHARVDQGEGFPDPSLLWRSTKNPEESSFGGFLGLPKESFNDTFDPFEDLIRGKNLTSSPLAAKISSQRPAILPSISLN